jgi:aspartokinase/homoserine dehydrogenase 1
MTAAAPEFDDSALARPGLSAGPRPRVLKFGGTSVGTPDRLRDVVAIVAAAHRARPVVCVVSAFAGVTSALDEWTGMAARGLDASLECALAQLEARHLEALAAIASGPAALDARAAVGRAIATLRGTLGRLAHEADDEGYERALAMSAGERLAAPVVAAGLRSAGLDAEAWDAADLVCATGRATEATVRLGDTFGRLRERYSRGRTLPVVTGFVAGEPSGRTVLLGRGGSDYTAALVGAALDADQVEIWTDVDGVLTADPRVVADARPVPRLSYDDAARLAGFGAKVLHPKTVQPLVDAGIPIVVRNTGNRAAPGTRIEAGAAPIRAVAGRHGLALVSIGRPPGADGRLLAATALASLESLDEEVVLTLAPSGRHALSVVVRDACVVEWLRRLDAGRAIEVVRPVALAALVGTPATPAHIATVDAALAQAGVEPHAVAGATGGGIAAVVGASDLEKAVEALHAELVDRRGDVSLVVAGVTGHVGRALLDALTAREVESTANQTGPLTSPRLRVVGLINRSRMAWLPAGLTSTDVEGALRAGEAANWPALRARLLELGGPRLFVDCTASEEMAVDYATLLGAGVGIATPNKRANAGPLVRYRLLRALARRRAPYGYETTVGAALPVLGPLRDLVRAGDRLRSFTGVLSGTLAFVLDRVNADVAFSAAVREAADLGFTEPHPADDLSGEDVARKLLILLREAGLDVERDGIAVESLVPAALADERDPSVFLSRLAEFDELWRGRVAEARSRGASLVYQAEFDGRRARVGLADVEAGSPLSGLRPAENVLIFTTANYASVPLTIAGPGAGPALTAAGVLADVDRAARALVGSLEA